MKEDLRVIKSRIAIENAFINLVEMKGFAAISIKEIAEKAIVNRNTIYLNYGSKEGILESIVRASFQKYFGDITVEDMKIISYGKKHIEQIFDNLFKVIDENIELYRVLLTDQASTGYLQTEVSKLRKQAIQLFKSTTKNEVYVSFILAGVWGVVNNYIVFAKGTKEENVKILSDLAISNLRHLSLSK